MKKLLLITALLGASLLVVGCGDDNRTTNNVTNAQQDENKTEENKSDEVGKVINTYTVVSKARISAKRITKYDDIVFLSCKAFIGADDEDMTDVLGVLLVKDELLDYVQTRMGDTKSLLEWEFEITDLRDSALACGLIYSKDGTEVKQRSRNSYPNGEEPETTSDNNTTTSDDGNTTGN